jgi:hypothetical protein
MAKQLKIDSITQVGPYTLRVKFIGLDMESGATFTAVPYLNLNQKNNALRKNIYSVSGKTVASVSTVEDYFDCVDVVVVEVIGDETLSLTIDTTNKEPVADWHGYELLALVGEPYVYTFENIICQVTPPSPAPATIEQLVRRYMSPILDGPNFRSLIAALSVGEKYNSDNANAAFKQLYVNTASGDYLERLGANYGIYQTQGEEMDDEHFRQYIHTLYNKKVTEDALYSMIEVFYRITSTRAYARSTSTTLGFPEDGTMTIVFDGVKQVTITFFANEFTEPTTDNAAVLIDRKLREQKVSGQCDTEAGGTIRLFSNTKGLRSSVEILSCPSWLPFSTGVKYNLYSNVNPAYMGRDDQGVLQIFLPVLALLSMGRDTQDGAYDQSGTLNNIQQLYYPTSAQVLLKNDLNPSTVSGIEVVDATALPSGGGQIFIAYGFDYQLGPIQYTNILGNIINLNTPLTVTTFIPANSEINIAEKITDFKNSTVQNSLAIDKLIDTLTAMMAAGEKYKINKVYPNTSLPDVTGIYS